MDLEQGSQVINSDQIKKQKKRLFSNFECVYCFAVATLVPSAFVFMLLLLIAVDSRIDWIFYGILVIFPPTAMFIMRGFYWAIVTIRNKCQDEKKSKIILSTLDENNHPEDELDLCDAFCC